MHQLVEFVKILAVAVSVGSTWFEFGTICIQSLRSKLAANLDLID